MDPRYTGLAPGVPHFANFPLAALQRTGFAGVVGHLTNLPFEPRQGAATAGVAAMVSDAAAISKWRIMVVSTAGNSAGPS